MTTTVKTCFKCNAEKPLTEFYMHKRMGDGHLNKCKACTKNDASKHRKNPKHRDRILAYDRARGSRQGPEYFASYKKRFPEKVKAQNMISNAVRDGRLAKPDTCSHCHGAHRLEAHHPDYSHPLKVVWLCAACHKQLHALLDTVESAAVIAKQATKKVSSNEQIS